MKRKFSFNLAPVKIPGKDETKATPEPTPGHVKSPGHAKSQSQPLSAQSQSHSHHSKHSSKDSITDWSPYINRRVLDSHTETELRLACQLILQNFKPSDHGMEDTDPKLDFGGMQRGREQRTKDRNATRSEPKVRLPTGAPVDLKTALEARGLKQTELTLRQPGDPLPVRANSSKKRADFDWLDERGDKREEKLRKSSSQRRRPRHSDDPASVDAQAAEWMNQQRDKEDPSNPQARPSTAVAPSRSRSIRDNIKEYVFPGTTSRTISRAPSHGSLRTMNTNVSQDSSAEPPHSASGQGWRSWALPGRRSSSRSNSRPGTSKGQPEEAEQPKKSTVNLNRELPPLPSLDSWKESVQPAPEKAVRSPTSAAHIASLMRPQDRSTPERVVANNKAHRRSGSDTLAVQYNAQLNARSPTHSKHAIQSASRSKTLTPDSFGQTLVGSVSTGNLGHIRQKSTDSPITPRKSGELLNFSRKMSVDTPTRSTFSNEVKVSRKEEQKSRLKKVFSGWMTKKEKKEDWMHKIEKEGVKEGVMVQDGAASAPVVRY